MTTPRLQLFSIFLLNVLLLVQVMAQTSPQIEWQKCLGGSGYDYAYNLTPTIDGGYLLAGYSNSTDSQVTGNHGTYDAWIVKLDEGGNLVKEKSFGGSGIDEAFDIMQTSDSNYLFVGLSGSDDGDLTGNKGLLDFWVVKMDTNQQIIWQKNYGGSESERAIAAEQTFDGGYAVIGFTFSSDGDVTGHHDSSDFWLLRLDSKGDLLWQKCLGGSAPDWGSSVKQLPDGGYIVSGRCSSNDGDVTGNHGDDDVWIARLDSNGNIIWQKSYGGSNSEDYSYAIPTNDGGFIVGAITRSTDGDVADNNGYDDYWILRLNSAGDLLWQKSYGGCCDDDDYYIVETADHGYVLAGHVFSGDQDITDNHGASDVWVIKIDSVGNLLWQKAMGGDDLDGARSMELTSDGGYIVMGSATSNNGDVSGNHGDVDYWAIKLSCDLPTTYFADADSDGYGNPSVYEITCGPTPIGFITDSSDCNDSDPQVNPDAAEVCNEVDDNCNGSIDEGVQLTFYADSDGDGFGNPLAILYACAAPLGYVTDSTDCNDTNPEVNPDATEIQNGIDDNCNGAIDEFGVGINGHGQQNPSIDIFPSPATDLFTISLKDPGERILQITIYDVTGRKIYSSSEVKTDSQNSITLDVCTLTEGTYFINVRENSGTTIKKFMVVR